MSLSDARTNYAAIIVLGDDPSSVANGGRGMLLAAAEEFCENHPELY